MLEKLKTLNLDRILDLDEAVQLSAYARSLEVECNHLDLPVPEWLEKAAMTLREEIARRTRAADLARLRDLEGELEGYKTVGEKKNEAARKRDELRKKLGLMSEKATARG